MAKGKWGGKLTKKQKRTLATEKREKKAAADNKKQEKTTAKTKEKETKNEAKELLDQYEKEKTLKIDNQKITNQLTTPETENNNGEISQLHSSKNPADESINLKSQDETKEIPLT